jgi:heme exporter protein D
MAAVGTTEIVLMIMAVAMVIGVPLAVLVVVWILQRSKRALPAVQQRHIPEERHTTLIDF